MTEILAPYACDNCRSRKVACSRGRPGCLRCKDENVACNYSRSGVIRRNRKRKHETLVANQSSPNTPGGSGRPPGAANDSNLQSHLATDIAMTHERLNGVDYSKHIPLGALSSLSEACAAVWHDASEFEETGNGFFLFEEHTVAWVDSTAFVAALDKGRPLLNSAPLEVLDHLRECRPDQVHDRAWLVMYYSIILSMISSTDPTNQSTKKKLRRNIWLALNDVRLFLEPSEANIQALTLLACTVEEFTTPSLCWMLATNACRMLQALGINHRRLDAQTHERRVMLFWHLNLLDKGLALIFGRPPTFHRAMAREIGLPTLEQLYSYQSQATSAGAPGLFGAHYFYQRLLLTRIMSDIWNCLYEDAAPDIRSIEVASEELKSWYRQARELLEAAAVTEKPFLNARSAASIDIGLHSLRFIYLYLLILLARFSSQMRTQCIDSSKQMLHLLKYMVVDFDEPYISIVWQLLCGPFTPFLELFGEIVSNGKANPEEKQENLAAMEQLPVFLGRMSSWNSLAAKLERIAVAFVQHAKSVMHPQGTHAGEAAPGLSIPNGALPDPWPSTGNILHWDAFFNHAVTSPVSGPPQTGNYDAQTIDLEAWTSDFFGDAMFDWIGWESHI
ncbi:uncharacterized protein BDR25DRAFT_343257 [Lindgomyces ingoldianus]|uniref:Uncharacterized protein n=1 Tax=Lindgomyces ingoldianus TaxID=673940 RepID=A0ACB6QV01_9PLEO|nr:uncharacterized protein BDR25DRAFT_343257 [Lindgomyces ingoldianus]KAF2470016.1 hypothetical protein BDR25DRAFT_343257 [Lindgomyces ingoldianus]